MEVAVRDEQAVLDEHERIVGRRVELGRDRVVDVVEQVAAGPVHLWRAAQRVGVLHLVAPAVRLVDGGVVKEREHVGGRVDLAAQRARGVDLGQEAGARALQRLERECASDIRRLRQPARPRQAERAERGHELRAVHERQALLGLQPDRLEAGRRQRFGARKQAPVEPGLALANQRQRKVREWRQVTARPDRPAARHARQDAAVEALDEQLDRLDPGARKPFRERIRAQHHRCPHDLRRVRLAHPARVAAQQADLELLAELLGNRARDKAAEAGVDAVRVLLPPVEGVLDQLPRRGHPLSCHVGQPDRRVADGNRPDVGNGEIFPGESPALDHVRECIPRAFGFRPAP